MFSFLFPNITWELMEKRTRKRFLIKTFNPNLVLGDSGRQSINYVVCPTNKEWTLRKVFTKTDV